MKIEASYSYAYKTGSLEVSDGNANITVDWVGGEELKSLANQLLEAYIELSNYKLSDYFDTIEDLLEEFLTEPCEDNLQNLKNTIREIRGDLGV